MTPDWSTTICCASGPSFSEERAALIIAARRRNLCRVVVVNDNYRRVPNGDIEYAADGAWWKTHIARVRQQFGGELWTPDHKAAAAYALNWVEFVIGDRPLPADDARISGGRNSGLQGMMLARQRGARRLILVGFDMQCGPAGKEHWFGSHPTHLANGNPQTFVKHFNNIAGPLRDEGTEVINCSAMTALKCFPRGDLATELAALEMETTVAND